MSTLFYLSLASAISSSYVALLYAFDFDGVDRNDPRSVKRRFVAAAVNNIASIACTYAVLSKNHDSPLSVMGIHLQGIYPACFLSAVLTCICYTGTLVLIYIDGQWWPLFDIKDWKNRASNIIWIRNTVMAPITEELAFRACAATLVLQCLSSTATVFVAPLPFALSHLHHVFDDMRKGCTQCQAVCKRGHILAPIVSHSICNNMGLPLLQYIGYYPKRSTRALLWFSYIFGFISWLCLLKPLTDSKLYS